MPRRAILFRCVAPVLLGASLWLCVGTAWAHRLWARGATDPVGEWVLVEVEVVREEGDYSFLRSLETELRAERGVARLTLHADGRYVAHRGMAARGVLAEWAVRVGTTQSRVPPSADPAQPGAGLLTEEDVRLVTGSTPELDLKSHAWRRQGQSFVIDLDGMPYATAALWTRDDLREVLALGKGMFGAHVLYRWRRVL